MKLAVDVRMINASGIGTYLKNVLPGLLHLFDEVIVLGNIDELQKFSWFSRVTAIAFEAKIYSLAEQLQYPGIIPECDIFWTPHFNAPLLPIKAKKRVVTIHDVYHLSKDNEVTLFHKLYAKLLLKNAVNRSAAILTVSEFSKSEITRYTGANPAKIDVVYCGVDRLFFEGNKQPAGAVLSLPTKYILFVGNVKPHKNLITLLKAYNALEKGLQDNYKLVIIGKKEGFITQDSNLMGYIETNGLTNNILFTGYLEDYLIPIIYKKAALFVFPSLYEGFGLPVLEALAAGTPVLSSDAASLPEVGGDAVEYFKPLNVESLTSKISHALHQSRRTPEFLAKAEKQTALFSWQLSVENHIAAFKKII